MPTAKKRHTALIKSIRLSTPGAMLDACSGYSGNCDCTVLVCSLLAQIRARRGRVSAAENQYGGDNAKNREDCAHAHHAQNRGTVAGGRRIVLETKEHDVVDGRADFSGGRIHQSQPKIAAGVFHTVKVTRNSPIRRQYHDPAGMGE